MRPEQFFADQWVAVKVNLRNQVAPKNLWLAKPSTVPKRHIFYQLSTSITTYPHHNIGIVIVRNTVVLAMPPAAKAHSTVTLLAKFLGLSTSVPRAQAVW